MPVVIEEFEIVPIVEPAPTAAPGSSGSPQTLNWSADLARKLQEQLNLALERQQRLQAD
jgi:hypothetical protein